MSRRNRGEEHGMKRYARGLIAEEERLKHNPEHHQRVAESNAEFERMKAHRERAKAEAHRLAKAAGGTYYENGMPPPVGGRQLQVANPNESGMAHHFEDAE